MCLGDFPGKLQIWGSTWARLGLLKAVSASVCGVSGEEGGVVTWGGAGEREAFEKAHTHISCTTIYTYMAS